MIQRTESLRRMRAPLLALAAALALSLTLHAKEARGANHSETDLAKKTQNPVADLISVPFQSNFNFNTGTKEVGALVNNQWSVAGWDHKDVNSMVLQPFVNYNFEHGWYATSAPILTGNWTARASDQWTVPVGGGVGKLFKIGPLPVDTQLQGFYNADRPKDTADWQLRFQLQFLFPKWTASWWLDV